MINAVSFKGTQPTVEKKEPKKTHAATGFVLGAAGGAAAGYVLGKKSEFDNVDTFVASSKETVADATKSIDAEDKKPHVATLIKEQESLEAKTKAIDSDLEKIFGKDSKDDAEKDVKDLLANEDHKPTFEAVKASVADKADEAITKKETSLADLTAAAEKVEKGKTSILGEQKLDAPVVNIMKDAEGKVEVQIGKMVKSTAPDAKEGDLAFKPDKENSKIELKAHSEAVTKEVAKDKEILAKNKDLAAKYGVKPDSADNLKIKKSAFKDILTESSKKASQEATTAFDEIKELFPKTKVSGKAVAIYAAVGAVVAGLIGHMMKKKEA